MCHGPQPVTMTMAKSEFTQVTTGSYPFKVWERPQTHVTHIACRQFCLPKLVHSQFFQTFTQITTGSHSNNHWPRRQVVFVRSSSKHLPRNFKTSSLKLPYRYWTNTSSLKLDDLPPDHVVKFVLRGALRNILPETSKPPPWNLQTLQQNTGRSNKTWSESCGPLNGRRVPEGFAINIWIR